MSRERYQDALWYNKPVKILIFGAGGIGSWSSFFLTRAGFDVRIFDFDRVEEHNLGGQMFLHQDIGKLKIDAVNNVARLFNNDDYMFRGMNFKVGSNFSFNDRGGFYEYNPRIATIVISAFDNMEARKNLFTAFTAANNTTPMWFIDGRLLMEQMRIYCINKSHQKSIIDYIDAHLFDDSEVEELSCTMKQVGHGAAMIATHITGFVTNIVSNEFVWREEVFQVPYMWDYIIPTNSVTQKLASEL
jgi:hypothetical protein